MTGFGAALRELRAKYGLSMRRLWLLCELGEGHLSRLERGERRPRRETIARINAAAPWTALEGEWLMARAGFLPDCLAGAEDISELGELARYARSGSR